MNSIFPLKTIALSLHALSLESSLEDSAADDGRDDVVHEALERQGAGGSKERVAVQNRSKLRLADALQLLQRAAE